MGKALYRMKMALIIRKAIFDGKRKSRPFHSQPFEGPKRECGLECLTPA
jgi:hypothetical protein